MGDGRRSGAGDEAAGRKLTVAEAAEALGITAEAVRSRIKRGTLPTTREGGAVYVILAADQARQGEGRSIDRTEALIAALSSQVEDLREQLRAERQGHAEARRLLAAALDRIPPQIEAPSEPRESPTGGPDIPMGPTPSEAREGPQEGSERPWWRRMFGA